MPSNAEKYQIEFAKRIIISAGFYFGRPRQLRRNVADWISKNGRQPSTHSDVRDALDIKSDSVWFTFVQRLLDTRCLIRTSGGISYELSRHADKNGEGSRKVEMTLKIDRGQDGMRTGTSGDENAAQLQEQLNKLACELGSISGQRERESAQAKQAIEALKKEVEAAKASKPTIIVVDHVPSGTKVDLGMQHKQLGALLMRLSARLSVYLVGPAGSGKTTAAENAAKALKLAFGFMSVGPQTTKTDILGYQSATGNYVETEFRRRYEHGGVFLFDEIDAGNGGVLTCINAALAGTACAFPDKMIVRHADFICVAAGNTYGSGPDRVYVGRQELDGASLDRFDFLDFSYDEALERAIVDTINPKIAERWVPFVQAARKAVAAIGERHIVSPRSSIGGVKLMLAGADWSATEETQLWKAMKPATVARVKERMRADGYALHTMTRAEIEAAKN